MKCAHCQRPGYYPACPECQDDIRRELDARRRQQASDECDAEVEAICIGILTLGMSNLLVKGLRRLGL